MNPDDLDAVHRSWERLRDVRTPLLDALERRCTSTDAASARERAAWVLEAVETLIDLLECPSALGERARDVTSRWPDATRPPSVAIEGTAWIEAAHECDREWPDGTSDAWRAGWCLVAEVLAEQTMSPFEAEARPEKTGAEP